MNDTSDQPDNAAASARTKRNEWPIFISYRRSDATRKIALELKKELEASSIEATTGQTFALDVFVDVAEAHQSDFQANLVPHLEHSRALIVLADDGAASRKIDGSVDYLYSELDWWANERKKTPPIILQLNEKAGSRLVADPQFLRWRKVSFMDCFWEKWGMEVGAGETERKQLIGWLRESIRNYGLIIHRQEVLRLKRRALIAFVFGVAACCAAAFGWLKWIGETTEREKAERATVLARNRLAKNHLDHGRLKYVGGEHREALAHLNEARKLDPELKEIDLMIADSWEKVSSLRAIEPGLGEPIHALSFSPDGKQLLIQDKNTVLRRHREGIPGTPIVAESFHPGMPQQLFTRGSIWCSRFRTVPSPNNPGYVDFFLDRYDWTRDVVSDSFSFPPELGKPKLIQISPSGRRAFGTRSSGSKYDMVLCDFETQKHLIHKFDVNHNADWKWNFVDGDRYIVGMNTRELNVWQTESGFLKKSYPLESWPTAFSSYGNRCCVGLQNGKVLEFRFSDEVEVTEAKCSLENQAIVHLEYTTDGALLLVAGGNGDGGIFDAASFESVWNLNRKAIKGVVYTACLSSSGRFVAIGHGTWITVFDIRTNERLMHHSFRAGQPSAVTISEDEFQVAVGTASGEFWAWNMKPQPRRHRSLKFDLPDTYEYSGLQMIEPGSFSFVSESTTYKYELESDTLSVLNAGGLQNSVSERHGLVAQSYTAGFPTRIYRGEDSTGISSDGVAQNYFLRTSSAFAGLVVENDGRIRPYNAEPHFLTNSYKSENIQGIPKGVVFSTDENTICVAYNKRLLVAQLNDKGIASAREIEAPSYTAGDLRLYSCDSERVLVDFGSGTQLFDLNSGRSKPITHARLQDANLVEIHGKACILGIDANGTVSLWDENAVLMKQTNSPVSAEGVRSSSAFDQPKPGKTMLVSVHEMRVYTTFGDQVLAWSLPALELIWRSAPLPDPMVNNSLNVIEFGRGEGELLVAEPGRTSEDPEVFARIHVLQIPKDVPIVSEVESYLLQMYGIKMENGRLITP